MTNKLAARKRSRAALLYRNGVSQAEIARRLDVAPGTISRWAFARGWTRKATGKSDKTTKPKARTKPGHRAESATQSGFSAGGETAAADGTARARGHAPQAAAAEPIARPGDVAERTSKPARRVNRAQLVRRLYVAIERNLQHLEQRMNDDTTPSAADGERNARALSTAIRNLEKVTELDAGTERDADIGTGKRGSKSPDKEDSDRIRLELAERILKLRQQRRAERAAGRADHD